MAILLDDHARPGPNGAPSPPVRWRPGRANALGAGAVRLTRSCYAPAASDDSRAHEQWLEQARCLALAVSQQTPASTVVGYAHAAMLHGIDVLVVPAGVQAISRAKGPSQKTRQGYSLVHRELTDDETTRIDGVRVTSFVRTVVDCLRTLPIDGAFVVADSALRLMARPDRRDREASGIRLVGARRELAAVVRRERGWRGNAQARLVLDWADGWAESPLESLARRAALALGLPRPTLQARLPTYAGTFYSDATWRWPTSAGPWVTHLEADGRGKYEGSSYADSLGRFERHGDREEAIKASGARVVRVRWEHVREPDLATMRRRLLPAVPPDHREKLRRRAELMTLQERRLVLGESAIPYPRKVRNG